MLTAPKYLDIVNRRGQEGKPLERIYRIIRKPEILQMAYMNLYANKGATTVGTDPNDVIDGMSMQRIMALSGELRDGRFRWKPVRRIYITKANGNKRPLGIPGWKDKMVQEAMRLVLNAYYEPQFSNLSHGFRDHRSCHTALTQVKQTWMGTKWFIEGDIKGCYDHIDHDKLMAILARDIRDDRFLKLIRQMLAAGYLEDWRYHQTLSGTPQGGVVSPLLANVYLNELDKYVEDVLIPEYTRGTRRRRNPAYRKLQWARDVAKAEGDRERVRQLERRLRTLPYGDQRDPNYRRLKYVRYADDLLLGFAGPRTEAEQIRERLALILRENLNLELSMEKTFITHARTQTARFLGYNISVCQEDSKLTHGQRQINGQIALRLPRDVRIKWIRRYSKGGKPIARAVLRDRSDYDIVKTYAMEFSGIVNYYALAINVSTLNDLKYVMQRSLVKTLATKHKTSFIKTFRRYVARKDGRKVIQVTVNRDDKPPLIATFGDKSCRRRTEPLDVSDAIPRLYYKRSELLQRMLAEKCEICESEGNVEVHHIRKLSDLRRKWQGKRPDDPDWVKRMLAMHRKSLVVCRECHRKIHNGEYDGTRLTTL